MLFSENRTSQRDCENERKTAPSFRVFLCMPSCARSWSRFTIIFFLHLSRSSRCVNVNEWVWARPRSYVYFSLPCVCVCIAMHKCKASMPIVVRRQLQYTWDKIISIFINQSEKKCRKNAANEQRKNVRIAHTHSNTRTQWTNESQREKVMLRIKKVLKLYACINEEWQIDGEASEMKHF